MLTGITFHLQLPILRVRVYLMMLPYPHWQLRFVEDILIPNIPEGTQNKHFKLTLYTLPSSPSFHISFLAVLRKVSH